MHSYCLLSHIISPLVPLWINHRAKQGKEDPKRLRERFGHPSAKRPKGSLLWLHAASVGEANSVLLLIRKINEVLPDVHIMLTTGTVTSAKLMKARLPKTVLHQFVPVDIPAAVERFMRHWHPDFAFWVESELWPNLVFAADEYQCFTGMINARMSESSFKGWQKHPALIRDMLRRFNLIFAQSETDAERLRALGASDVLCLGNLKYDADILPCNEESLLTLQNDIQNRPAWLAASTHPGEEELVAEAHSLLTATRSTLLTIIAPRHPDRGAEIAAKVEKFGSVALRSKKQPITATTQFYIADTLGELGIFYRLCEQVFMGGSLVPHGGQNPLEAARLACAIVAGPHTHNFEEVYAEIESKQLMLRATSSTNLATQMDQLFIQSAMRQNMQAGIKAWVEGKSGTADRLMNYLEPIMRPTETA